MSKTKPKGISCECGKFNEYPAYVYAHWKDDLTFTCECGRKYSILEGVSELLEVK